ncbi:uncharacterized protein [Cicer arietinum]|uniref:Uncharacterized protein LOC101500548 n=1 Tax=Cicer arietinum TaxID=3827 RepID=A0A1S2Y9J8_CICAR|nr:uncharacterized protein LOC101500548 [Cicer arietinum]
MMSERTLIPTFIFWAFLTIITPTLILLSENSKAELDLNGNIRETMKVRRMMRHTHNEIRTAEEAAKSLDEEELAPAPTPATVSLPLPLPTLKGSQSHHNHTLIIRSNFNSSDDASKVQVQVKQTTGNNIIDGIQ